MLQFSLFFQYSTRRIRHTLVLLGNKQPRDPNLSGTATGAWIVLRLKNKLLDEYR